MSDIYDKYEAVIGLEIHVQLLTNTKAYAPEVNEYGALPNHNVGPISLGHPGTLPKLNTTVIDHAIKLGLACKSDITREMNFSRKNYFYPDLPKGYQITQDDTPICTGGEVLIRDKEGNEKRINVTRIHIEEDAGKSIHDQDPYNTLVDLNRAGVPLLEIVSEPEIKNGEEAYSYVTEIRKLVRYLEICDGNMEEGSMRCDANVSVMPKGSTTFGQRAEVKNMNSIRNVQRAIEFEIKRQIDLIEDGGEVVMETRSFDAVAGTTFSMRSKEMAHDYRYFPEPDLQPLHVSQEHIDEIQRALPPLPNDLFDKYVKEYGLTEYDAGVLTAEKDTALYYEGIISSTDHYKAACNWLTGDIRSFLNKQAISLSDFPLEPGSIAELIQLVGDNKISYTAAAQKLLPVMIEHPDRTATEIAESESLLHDTDENAIEDFVRQVLDENPSEVERYRSGQKQLVGFFMGKVMKLTQGKADPKATNQVLQKLLEDE